MKKHIRQVQLPEKKKREAIMPLAKSAAPVSPVPERQRVDVARIIADLRALGRSNGSITVEELLSARGAGRKY